MIPGRVDPTRTFKRLERFGRGERLLLLESNYKAKEA